jgi:hypothetical protein
MRSKRGWSDVTIRNISPHGMMLLAPFPPKPGTVVEVRKASLALVGRVIWVKGKTLGIQLIERLNFNALLRAANEGWAASQVNAPSSTSNASGAATAGVAATLPDTDRSGALIGWLIAGTTIVFAGACAAITLLQV